jgi:hypothetical protein
MMVHEVGLKSVVPLAGSGVVLPGLFAGAYVRFCPGLVGHACARESWPFLPRAFRYATRSHP